MGGSDDKQESTTESSPWAPAQGNLTNALDWANQIMSSGIINNVPTMDQTGMNSNLSNAWDQMSGSGLTDLASQMGQYGADMMGQFDAGALKDIYGQLAAGPSLYNQQSQAATLMAGKQAYLDEQNATSMAALEKSMAEAGGQIYGQAAGGGNVGSSRTQLATGQANSNLAAQQAATMANLYSQSYDTTMSQAMANEQARLAGLSQQATGMMGMASAGQSALGTAGNIYQQSMNNMLQAGSGQMAWEQQNNMIDYQNAYNQWMAPQNMLSWYSGIAQGIGGMGGTNISTQTGNSGLFSQMLGIAGNMGSSYVSGGMAASDKRLKDNIIKLGVDNNTNLNVYQWSWNKNAEELAKRGYGNLIGANSGYIAQEVQEIYPEATVEHESGYLLVDYGYLENLKQNDVRGGAE